MTANDYRALIREVPDFPKPGILFYDITTLLKDPKAFSAIADELTARYRGQRIDKVVGIESRGFIFGGTLAHRLNAGFVPVRKPGKLPADCFEVKYSLEYGSNSLAIHRDAVSMTCSRPAGRLPQPFLSSGSSEARLSGSTFWWN
jgi:adenine phosphoribosyltransferase